MQRISILLGLALLLPACSSREDVVKVRNVERAVTRWHDDADPMRRVHICLEYSSPAEKLESTKAALGVPIGDKAVNVTYESAQSLASIYSVSEIMQFGHAALYRLCEAAGNESVTKAEYERLFNRTLENVNHLLELQLLQFRGGVDGALVDIRGKVLEKDEAICKQLQSPSTTGASLEDLKKGRKELVERFEATKKGSSSTIELPNEISETGFKEAREAETQLEAIRAKADETDAGKAKKAAACKTLQNLKKIHEKDSCPRVHDADLAECTP